MATLLTRTSASALYMIAAITAITLGVFAGVFSLLDSYATVEVIPLRTAFGSIITGIGFLLVFRKVNIASIVFGISCIGLASNLIVNRLFLDESFVLTIPTTLMLLNNFHFFLLGFCFCLPFNRQPGQQVWRFTGYFSLTLAAVMFIYTFVPDETSLTLPIPVSFVAVCALVALTGVMLLTRYSHRNSTFEMNQSFLLPAILVTITAIIIWLSLTLAAAHAINQRGLLLTEQASQRIDSILSDHLRAAQRMSSRWQQFGDNPADTVQEDAQLYLRDFSGVTSVMLVDEQTLYFQLNADSTIERGWLQDPRLFLADSKWLGSAEQGLLVQIPTYTIDRNQPSFLFAIPVNNPDIPELKLVVAMNIFSVLDAQLSQVFDEFAIYIGTDAGMVIPTDSRMPLYRNTEDFIDNNPYFYSRTAEMLGHFPRPVYVSLKDTNTLWASARINQFVLFLGGFISLLLVGLGDSNRRLRRGQAKLNRLANYDTITGLKRRDALEVEIEQQLANNELSRETAWVLFVDLDGFKPVNDALGIHAGNRILSEVANRLRHFESEHLHIARFSSDEFILFATRLDEAGARVLAKDVLKAIRERFDIEGVTISLTASIGITRLTDTHSTPAEFIQASDVAMTEAKAAGGDTYRFYSKEMFSKYDEALRLRGELQKAIEQKAFQIYYQPIVDSKAGKIIGVEALARWQQKDGSFVPPALFIPVAEQTGQIFAISEQILEQACTDLQWLQKEGIFVSVNISGALLQRGKLQSFVDSLLDEHQVQPDKLHFEVTEGVFLSDKATARNTLHALRDRGLNISIDDFGTGYSSLSLLYQLPVDTIKIDRTFIADLKPDSERYKVVCAIMALAGQLNKQVIVEGVETEEQLQFAQQKSCTAIQGYYYYKPMPFEDLKNLLT